MKYSKKTFLIFILPAVAVFVFVVVVPFINGLYGSFTNWTSLTDSSGTKIIGFDNYSTAIHDSKFMGAFAFTIGYTIAAVITVNILALCLAFLLRKAFRGRNVFRSVFFLPNLIGGLVLGFAWKILFSKGFESLGIESWLTNHKNTFGALVLVTTWQNAGYMMIIFAAALENIPQDQIEAARTSGAGRVRIFFKVILPNLMAAITVTLFLTLQKAVKVFSLSLALTNGGVHGTQVVAINIYNSAFMDTEANVFNHFGVAQAKAAMFTLVISSIALVQIGFTKRREIRA